MRRLPGVLCLLACAIGPSTARAAPADIVADEPAYLRDGAVQVRVSCPVGTCTGTLRANRSPVSFRLAQGEDEDAVAYVAVPVRRPGRRVALRLRQGTGTSRLRLPVRRAIDRVRCGYGRYATILRTAGSTRLLRVQLAAGDADRSQVVACRRGRTIPVSVEERDEYGSDSVSLVALTDDWVAAVTRLTSRNDQAYGLTLQSLGSPAVRRSTFVGAFGDFAFIPQPVSLAVADDGAVLLVRAVGTGHEICAFDARFGRRLDAGPTWTRRACR